MSTADHSPASMKSDLDGAMFEYGKYNQRSQETFNQETFQSIESQRSLLETSFQSHTNQQTAE